MSGTQELLNSDQFCKWCCMIQVRGSGLKMQTHAPTREWTSKMASELARTHLQLYFSRAPGLWSCRVTFPSKPYSWTLPSLLPTIYFPYPHHHFSWSVPTTALLCSSTLHTPGSAVDSWKHRRMLPLHIWNCTTPFISKALSQRRHTKATILDPYALG